MNRTGSSFIHRHGVYFTCRKNVTIEEDVVLVAELTRGTGSQHIKDSNDLNLLRQHHPILPCSFAGTPNTILPSDTFVVTTAPIPTTAFLPISSFGLMQAPMNTWE